VGPERHTDRTSAVVAGTLIFLTVLGVVTVFWEPLAALAVGTPAGETTSEPHVAPIDAGSVQATDGSGSS
jgi:hypothetical protein